MNLFSRLLQRNRAEPALVTTAARSEPTPALTPARPSSVRRQHEPHHVRPPAMLPETVTSPSVIHQDTVYSVERLHEGVVGELVSIRLLLEDLVARV